MISRRSLSMVWSMNDDETRIRQWRSLSLNQKEIIEPTLWLVDINWSYLKFARTSLAFKDMLFFIHLYVVR